MKVAIDFDGVAWSVVDSLGQLDDCPPIDDTSGERLTIHNCPNWDTVVEIWGRDAQFALAKLDEARHIDRLRHFGLFEDFDRAITTLQEAGHEPTILTHNGPESIAHIREFLAEQGLKIDVIAARPAEKIQWCLDNGAEVLVDDAPDTIRAASAAGLTVFAPRYLYNSQAIDETQAITGHGWSQLLPMLLIALNRPTHMLEPAVATTSPTLDTLAI